MQLIDARQVHETLEFAGLIAALRQAHLGGMPKHNARYIFEDPQPEGQPDVFITLLAWQPGEGILSKLVTSFPGNKARHGGPTVNSSYVFVDGETGVPRAIVDGEAMIFRKTAADSALGASILARDDAETMLMVGAGALAPYLVAAHLVANPSLRQLRVWNRTPENADRLVKKLQDDGINAAATRDLRSALESADLVVSATMATEPIVRGDHLKPGAHVSLIGSFTPQMREADDAVLRRATIFVDHRQCTERSGEFLGPFARGVITPDDVRGDLFELCQGTVPGRTSPEQITMIKIGGGSYMDYFATKYLIDRLDGRPFTTTCAS
jgi:ornithine cyclodeaminase/alanine dehydrogenase-like protein (mu-crystallin family)